MTGGVTMSTYCTCWFLPSVVGEGTTAVEIMHILPFDSFRKRMSVIVRHPVTKDIVLFCKGADTTIYTCLKPTESEYQCVFYAASLSTQS